MKKKGLVGLLVLLIAPALLIAAGFGIAWQQKMVSRSDVEFLVDLGNREGLWAVINVIKAEFYGPDTSMAGDTSYGRELVHGRGHAPWVMRGNLDGRPRILKFALAPELWAAYDVQTQSLYQLWQGEVQFLGAAYDYTHGPQPLSKGAWYWRNETPARWFLLRDGEELAAEINYLGHEYGDDQTTAWMRFKLSSGDAHLTLTEQPEIVDTSDGRVFRRSFRCETTGRSPALGDRDSSTVLSECSQDLRAGFYTEDGSRYLATGDLQWPLASATPIPDAQETGPRRGRTAEQDELAAGEAVIAGSDCLGCHAEHHRVAGPAWSQISGKFRAKLQDSVIASLARSVREGSVGTWGDIPMPAHPELTDEQARQAVAFILNTGEPEAAPDPPLDPSGKPYAATRDFDVLPRLTSLHPSLTLENVAPDGFHPKVGGMDWLPDGRLVVASWDTDGAVYVIDPNGPMENRVQRIAEGLQEPLGLALVDERLFVLQKQELTELIDTNGDGIIDRYRTATDDWPSSANFHSFAFGLTHRDDALYFLLSICVLPGGASCTEQLPTQGKLLRYREPAQLEVVASGFRTPNGITTGPEDMLWVTDNQGDWLPSSKLVEIREGDFYGSRAVPGTGVMSQQEQAPAVWLPQDEVGNSPTEPLVLTNGPYAGQLLHGDVYNGGVKRVYLDTVGERPQGAVFHFSAGFQGAVNRLLEAPDGSIFVGEIGNPPNWGEYNKLWYGLERIRWAGNRAFEMLTVRAQPDGFVIDLTQPLAKHIAPEPADLTVRQWFYRPDEQYGGPKYDDRALPVNALQLSQDRKQLRASITGLQPGHIVYLRLDERLRSDSNQPLWTAEAWYTLNSLPAKDEAGSPASDPYAWQPLFDGETLQGWRNYGGEPSQVEKWVVEEGALALKQTGTFPMWDLIRSVLFGGASGDLIYYPQTFRDFELELEWKISENGNSGIFYLVADEKEKTPWLTGIEMQVLDNEGHADGQIHTHRAGDLYDLIAAQPETVRPPGEWNRVRIRIQDNHIEHWLNDVKVVQVERGSDQWHDLVSASKFADMPRFGTADTGYIVLQDHGDPVWYRNIRLRKLPPTPGDGPDTSAQVD
ncbi:MAG: family 16 glycoside hydrolase [Pseudomonadota bacterium]